MARETYPARLRVVPAPDERVNWLKSIPFFFIHLAPLGAFITGTKMRDWVLCVVLYYVRMFFISAGLHRYFSHKSFKATRWFQFVLAFGSTLPAQKGFLWWASWHRVHHRVADKPEDVHSPSRRGFWWAHVGWILCDKYNETKWELVKQWTRYPELVWLNRLWVIPPTMLAVAIWWFWGTSALLIGFFASTAILYHGTFTINSLVHVPSKWLLSWRSHNTDDTSQNSLLLAPIHMGENWHNPHHDEAQVTKQGDKWWQIDGGYYILWVLSLVRIPLPDFRQEVARIRLQPIFCYGVTRHGKRARHLAAA